MSSENSTQKPPEGKSRRNKSNNGEQAAQEEQNKTPVADKVKAGKKTLRKPSVKLLLDLPFEIKPSLLEPPVEKKLLGSFDRLLERYPELKLHKPVSKKLEVTKEEQAAIENGKTYRSELIFGMNAVIRAVEKNKLVAVITSHPSQLPLAFDHMLPLCASRDCCCLCIDRFSEKVAPKFNITSLVALGFKESTLKSSSIFHNLVKMIQKITPNPQEVHKNLFSNKVATFVAGEVKDKKAKAAPSDVGPTFDSLYIKKTGATVHVKEEDFLSFTSISIVELGEEYFPDRTSVESDSISMQVGKVAQAIKAPVLRNLLPTSNSQDSLLVPPKVKSVVPLRSTRKRKAKEACC